MPIRLPQRLGGAASFLSRATCVHDFWLRPRPSNFEVHTMSTDTASAIHHVRSLWHLRLKFPTPKRRAAKLQKFTCILNPIKKQVQCGHVVGTDEHHLLCGDGQADAGIGVEARIASLHLPRSSLDGALVCFTWFRV